MSKPARFWIVKQEPSAYSWDTFVEDGRTAWTGVRNFRARENLRGMREGDLVLFYHSVTGKAVIGIARVAKEAYPDPTAKEGAWVCVDLVPVKALKRPVSLEEIKATPALAGLTLLRQPRLSVQELKAEEYDQIVAFGNRTPG